MFKDSSLTCKLQLYAPICLLVAAKAMELDERIPFIPKLRRYANPTFSVDDYRRAELHVLDMVDWNPQFSTVLEISEFLLCQGVLFSSDEVEERNTSGKEGLRENTQHVNTHHIEIRTDDKKEAEKIKSPGSKENQDNSYSDTSTTGTNTENLGTPMIQLDECSPLYQKHTSAFAGFETQKLTSGALVSVENKAEEIMTHFETGYAKLSTLLLRDINFVEWEPRVIAASMMAFFRCINKVTPIWNDELETITQLPFSEISSCFDLIHKKYSTVFGLNTHKILSVISASENQSKANSNLSEKSGGLQLKTELANKANISNNKPVGFESILKPVTSYQSKTSVTTAVSSNQMRDDLRFRTRYANGTVNTELPQRPLTNLAKQC